MFTGPVDPGEFFRSGRYRSRILPDGRKMKIRRVVTLTVLLSFLGLAYSGILLFLAPHGRVAYWAGWTLLGLSKDQAGAVHTTFMVLFLTVGVWHMVLNWRPITGYLKNRSKQIRILTPESTVALLITALFLVGPLVGLPPFRQFLDGGEGIKSYWEKTRGTPPWGHAEESRLQRFCRGMEDFERLENRRMILIDCRKALKHLQAGGLEVEGLDQTILEIAVANGLTPQDVSDLVMEVAEPTTPEAWAAALFPSEGEGEYRRPYSGLGRMTLASYAREYGYDLDRILEILGNAGYQVDPGSPLREVAGAMGTTPEGVLDILNEGASGTGS